MKKTAFILLAGLALLCSCEKIDSHYSYGETVLGTTIKENQLGQKITLQGFINATDGVRYEYIGTLPCIEDNGKVYYSQATVDNWYSGPYTLQIEFTRHYMKSYHGPDMITLILSDYAFNEEKQELEGVYLPNIDYNDNTTSKLIYVDENYLIFETNGIANEPYYSENSEFSRVVFARVTENLLYPERIHDIREIYATFPLVPYTAIKEKEVSDFEPITYDELLAITQDKKYHLQGKYLCLEDSDDTVMKYIPRDLPVDTDKSEDYNYWADMIGGTIDYYAFHNGYTSRYYYGIDGSGSELAGMDYANYTFDETSQLLSAQYVKGNVAYVSEACIILEAPLSEDYADVLDDLEIPQHNVRFFERTIFIHHPGELKEPTEINDYRQ